MKKDGICPDCGKTQDKYGYHALACKTASGAIDRHNAIVNGISDLLKKSNITCLTEQGCPLSDNRERPGDIFIPNYNTFGDAYLDVSVIHILAVSHIKKAATAPLQGSNIRYDKKIKKYPQLGSNFKPLILESTGGWHPYSFNTLKELAYKMATNSGKSQADLLNSLLTTCSVSLQRSQGCLLVRRTQGL